MATLPQIRGMLLEEAILFLLRVAGYDTVERKLNDPALTGAVGFLKVRGRGTDHQIDAIADFGVSPPFCNRQRLLVEAKCYSTERTIGIEVVRNAVGVLKDVEEFWVPMSDSASFRYHYQFAIFSTSRFTSPAQRYAFAQDVVLVPLENSRFARDIVAAIRAVTFKSFGAESWRKIDIDLGRLRKWVRQRIRGTGTPSGRLASDPPSDLEDDARDLLEGLFSAVSEVGGAVIGMLNHQVPVFLIPNPALEIHQVIGRLAEIDRIRVFYNAEGWFLTRAGNNDHLFSFDLPGVLFDLYSERGELSPERAVELKGDWLGEISIMVRLPYERPRLHTLALDQAWLASIRDNLQPEEEETPEVPAEEEDAH